nr:winged helix-turn-helix transcriptional regulator [Enterovirga sp. DB1703]
MLEDRPAASGRIGLIRHSRARPAIIPRGSRATVPPRVDYALTELGRSLTRPLAHLARWATDKRAEIEAARQVFDARGIRQSGARRGLYRTC